MNRNDRLSDSARLYVGAVIIAGAIAVVQSLYSVVVSNISYHWFVLAGLTLLSGSFTVRIPTVPARLSVSETFVFAAALLFGSAAATIIVVLDTLIISLWREGQSRRPFRLAFNMAAGAVAIWAASHTFYWLLGIPPLSQEPRPILSLVPPLMALALLYFLLNSVLVAYAVAFEKGGSAFTIWRRNFLWLSLNYFSGASVAALLLPYLQPGQSEFLRVIGVLLPLLFISYLTFKTALGRVDDANRHLSELNKLYLSTIETLAMAIDAKDQITHGHIRRVQTQAVRLAKVIGVSDPAQIQAIEAAALLHDMGKLAVPEYILNKPGPLTAAEFEKMKLHASVGADILSSINFPYPVVPIVRHHHENWDGTGYPAGLAGTDIPIGARILSVVDCFDALTSDRPYRPRLADKDAFKILDERRGRMYDPIVVDAFVRMQADAQPDAQTAQYEPSLTAITDAAVRAKDKVETVGPSRLEEIAASGEEMLVLFEMARRLTSANSLQETGDEIVRHLRRIVPMSLAMIYVYDGAADDLKCVHAAGEQSDLVSGLRISRGQRLSGWVAANRQTIRNSDPMLDLGESVRAMVPRLRSCLSTPLIANDSLVGVLSLYSATREAYSEEHQRVVEAVARQCSPAIRSAAVGGANSLVGHRSTSVNLPAVEHIEHIAKVFREMDRQRAMSLVLITIRDLREVNDKHGTDAGDRILKHISGCAQAVAGPGDRVFRSSGNEFVILLNADGSGASGISRALGEAITTTTLDLTNTAQTTIAIATFPEDGSTLDQLLTTARRKHGMELRPQLDGRTQPPESIH